VTVLHEYRFRAMNTDVAAWLWSDSPLAPARLRAVETFFQQVEAMLSRFRPDSELSRLNAAGGNGPWPASPLLLLTLAVALREARESGGIFDPTVLPALKRAGYDRSFELIGSAPGPSPERPSQDVASSIGWKQVKLDFARGTVTLPKGVGIDLGGIAKGWAVDRAAEMLAGQGGGEEAEDAALVDAGGDIRSSAAPGGEPWPIAIQHPLAADRDLGVLALNAGAVATTSIGGRRWSQNGRTMHHLIDPRTGEPSRSNLHAVTVVAPTTVEAEVAAKVALILGQEAGAAYLRAHSLSGLLMDHAGNPHMVGELRLDMPNLVLWR